MKLEIFTSVICEAIAEEIHSTNRPTCHFTMILFVQHEFHS